MKINEEINQILSERFEKDSLISVATVDKGIPFVRTVDAIYKNGSFYVITHELSKKMKQIAVNPTVAVCGEWFAGHGIGENLGWIRKPENEEIANELRTAFAAWYDNGHTNEDDVQTCILRVRLTDGILFANGKKFDLEF